MRTRSVAVNILFMALLIMVLLPVSAQAKDRVVVPRISYYCSTAGPLGLVWKAPTEKRPQRLIWNPITQMLAAEGGSLAVLTDDNEGTANLLIVYRFGKRLMKLKLKYNDIRIVGWYRGSVVLQADNRLIKISVPAGAVSKFEGPQDTVKVMSLPNGDVFIRETDTQTVIELRSKDGKKTTWNKPVGTGLWTVIGNRYLAIDCSPIVGDTIDTTKPRLWIIDLRTSKDKMIDMGEIMGFTPGRSADELIIGLPISASNFRVEALDLKSLKRKTLATVRYGDTTQLVGLSPDKQWVLLNTGYAEVGPGFLWAINLAKSKIVRLRENVYNCLLSP